MSRIVNGWLQVEDRLVSHQIIEDLAPFVSGRVVLGDNEVDVDFLIDSGSDITTLMPTDAYRLLEDHFFELPFVQDSSGIDIYGVGGSYRALPLDAAIGLRDEYDDPLLLNRIIWIAEPNPAEPSLSGNWDLPSIFGRDAIRPGDFELSYINGTVTLLRPDDE